MSLKSTLRDLSHPILRHLAFSLPAKVEQHVIRIPILEGTGLGVYEQFRRGEEAWKLALYRRLPGDSGNLFLDVGANLGQTLIELRQVDTHRPYLGFEPNPDCLHYVYRLIKINEFPNVELVAAGIGDSTGLLTLYLPVGRSTDSTATLLEDLRPEREYDTRHVPIFSDEHVNGLIAKRPLGFVKIDVEGAELEVLRGIQGILRRERPPILCEVLFTDPKGDLEASRTRNENIMSLLRDLSYRVLQIRKSPDLRSTVGFVPIEIFPVDYYCPANMHECDYLFLPDERAEELLNKMA